MLIDFQNLFNVIFSMNFATKSMSYFSSYLKDVTPVPCKILKTKTGELLLHVTQ